MDFEHIAMLAGGLGLFLYGMHLMGDGLEVAAGNRLRSLLNVLTRNRFLAILVGFLFTWQWKIIASVVQYFKINFTVNIHSFV